MLTEKPTPSLQTIAPREETHRWRAIWHWLMRLTLSSVLLAGLALAIWVALFINALREGFSGHGPSQYSRSRRHRRFPRLVCVRAAARARRGRWAFKELKAAQARLQDMTESSFDWAWETDADLRYAYISGQVAGASNSEQNSYIGKTRFEIADLTHDPDGWKCHAEDMAARRPFRDFVFRQPMADGGARWRKVSGKPFYDAAGRFCGYRGTAIDITAQKEAEQALSAIRAQQKERDRSYRTLIANISGAVYRMKMDEEWTDIFISDAVEKIWGYSAAECLAKAAPLFATAIHPDDRDMVTQGTKEAIEKRAPYAFEYRIRHRDGSTRWVSDRGQPIFDEAGQLLYLDGIFFDVTDRMRAETELKRAKELAEVANAPSRTSWRWSATSCARR